MFTKQIVINLMYLTNFMSYFVTTCEYRSKTCTYTSCTTIVEPHFKNINITVDNVWRTVTSTLYCGDNDCSRELHVTLGENVSWQNGRELSEEHSVSNALVEGFTTGSATTFRGDIGFTYKFLSASVGSDIQFQKSSTRETSIETTSTTGSTVSYSLTKDNSIQREEVVTCTAKAGQGIKLLAKTNAIHFTAHFCRPSETGFSQTTPLEYSDRCNPLDAVTDNFIYSDCNYLDFTMLPFNGNAISADIKCLTIRIQK